jgi:hypothetical protein
MSPVAIILLGVGLGVVACGTVAWLKGNLAQVGATFRELGRHAGEPWTWAAFFEPAGTIPVVFVLGAFGLAQPDSRWARRFYRGAKLERARRRFG